ncbi:peroxisome assembly protein 10-B-like [Saccoglossus kowalevskii]|uniref:RING-type E3 ubiquitin transferase n=1 Tax=Saccoglossus kowalevskii TaxID=10224 RepID=A0ABM0GVN0_SACKO|nr:PREDICTED: peroxisome biogenesis factor 10-like [Saccoglossus kowalevskii]
MAQSRIFRPSGPAEIVRSNQKDGFYISYMRGSLANIFQTFAGARAWMQWRKEIDVSADLAYFLLTTVAGYQTLGEEYCNIVQVDHTGRAIPSRSRRLAHVLLQIGVPYVIDQALKFVHNHINTVRTMLGLSDKVTNMILQCIPVLRTSVTYVHRFHLALFYLQGLFYHVAKRVVSVRYLLVRAGISPDVYRSSYSLLGMLTLTQLTLTLLWQLYTNFVKPGVLFRSKVSDLNIPSSDNSETEEVYLDPTKRCSLCLESRKSSTATPCGHMFCWTCITEWCLAKPECPLCRETFQLSRLVCLQHFE